MSSSQALHVSEMPPSAQEPWGTLTAPSRSFAHHRPTVCLPSTPVPEGWPACLPHLCPWPPLCALPALHPWILATPSAHSQGSAAQSPRAPQVSGALGARALAVCLLPLLDLQGRAGRPWEDRAASHEGRGALRRPWGFPAFKRCFLFFAVRRVQSAAVGAGSRVGMSRPTLAEPSPARFPPGPTPPPFSARPAGGAPGLAPGPRPWNRLS